MLHFVLLLCNYEKRCQNILEFLKCKKSILSGDEGNVPVLWVVYDYVTLI